MSIADLAEGMSGMSGMSLCLFQNRDLRLPLRPHRDFFPVAWYEFGARITAGAWREPFNFRNGR